MSVAIGQIEQALCRCKDIAGKIHTANQINSLLKISHPWQVGRVFVNPDHAPGCNVGIINGLVLVHESIQKAIQMRKRKLTSIIISVSIIGFAIVTMISQNKLKQKSDYEVLREAKARMQQQQEDLRNKVLTAPESCAGVPAAIFSQVCENNLIYEDEAETVHIPYFTNVEPSQAKCIEDSHFAHMSLFAQKNGRVYEPDPGSNEQHGFISLHACSVSGDFALFIKDFSLEDENIDAATALNLWYQYDDDEYCRKSQEHSWCS